MSSIGAESAGGSAECKVDDHMAVPAEVEIAPPSRPMKDRGAHEKGLAQSFPVISSPAMPPDLPPKPPKAPIPASPTSSFDCDGPPRPVSAVMKGPNMFVVASTTKVLVSTLVRRISRSSQPAGEHLKEEELLTSASRAPLLLHLKVLSGTDLPIADLYSSDPFVMIYVGGKFVGKTRSILQNLNPVWDESFDIPLLHMNTSLELKVYDEVLLRHYNNYHRR